MLTRIGDIIVRGKSSPDFIFDKHCSDSVKKRMSEGDFRTMVRTYIKRVSNGEILQMFKHFDRGGKTYITKQDFSAAFQADIKDQTFQVQIEDIIKPLATKVKRHRYTFGQLFD